MVAPRRLANHSGIAPPSRARSATTMLAIAVSATNSAEICDQYAKSSGVSPPGAIAYQTPVRPAIAITVRRPTTGSSGSDGRGRVEGGTTGLYAADGAGAATGQTATGHTERMRLQLHVTGPAIEIENYVAAVPLVLERLAGLTWDAEGSAVADGQPSPRLRVVDGVGGQPGASYRYDADDVAEPVLITVTRADAEVIEATTEVVSDPATTLRAVVTLADPADPLTVRGSGTLRAAEVPGIFGKELTGEFTAHLRDFATAAEPQVEVRLGSRLGTATSLAHVVTAGDRWQVTVDLDLRLRGLAALGAPVLWFNRHRIAEAVSAEIDRALTEAATDIATGHGPTGTPEEIAEQAWQEIVADLHR